VNVFARESQIDIMAARAKSIPRVPLEQHFRPENAKSARDRCERFGYRRAAAPSGAHRRGLRIDAETYVAEIAEVAVDKATGG